MFNNNSTFGAVAQLTFNVSSNTLTTNAVSFPASTGLTPAANNVTLYARYNGGRMMPEFRGPSGNESPFQPFLGMNRMGLWTPPASSATAPGVFGLAAATATGTATARTTATTNFYTRAGKIGYVGTNGTNNVGGWRINLNNHSLGTGGTPSAGGFYVVFTWGNSDAVTNGRTFVGMTNSTAAPTSVEPATLTNVIGVGCGTANTNLYVYYGGSAAQTPINLGVNFPSQTANTDLYELILHAATNTWTEVDYEITRLNTGDNAFGSLTAATAGTQLPANTTLLSPRMWRATAATSGTPQIDIVNFYIESDYS